MTLRPFSRQFIRGTEVLVWDLDVAEEIAWDASKVLPAHEVRAALKAGDPVVRSRRLAGRILVRRTLSAWMDRRPAELVFETGPYGKPFLPSGPSFNLSHSGKYLALGIRPSGRVGIDIEVVRHSPDLPELAQRYFTESEKKGIADSPDGSTRAFFRVWVRKEAFLKATGFGLALPLDSFSVSASPLLPGANAVTAMAVDNEKERDWLVTSAVAPSNTALALAVDLPPGQADPRTPR